MRRLKINKPDPDGKASVFYMNKHVGDIFPIVYEFGHRHIYKSLDGSFVKNGWGLYDLRPKIRGYYDRLTIKNSVQEN